MLIGRFIGGLGTGIEGAIIGMVAKASKPANKAKQITIFYALKQFGIIFGPVCVALFLGSTPDRCLSKEDEDGYCLFAVNGFNSTGYMQIIIAVVIFIMCILFATYMEPYSEPAGLKGIDQKLMKNKTLKQIKPVGVVNEVSVLCCMCTMSLYCLQSTNEAILTQGQRPPYLY